MNRNSRANGFSVRSLKKNNFAMQFKNNNLATIKMKNLLLKSCQTNKYTVLHDALK